MSAVSTPKRRGRPPLNKPVGPRNPTMHEKIEVYERLLHDIQFHREVTMNNEAVIALLDKIGSWSYSHRRGNGEYNEQELLDQINFAFWQLEKR